MKRGLACLFLMMLVVGCTEKEMPLPQGIQRVHGYLQPVPFSLHRRGTHALLTASGGTVIAYAESSVVNLRALERQEVDLEGVLEKNISSQDSPVFVVQKALSGGAELLKPWSIPAMNLSLKLPSMWKGSINSGSATFTASGFTMPVLTITTKKAPATSTDPVYGALPSPAAGELFVVGLRKATAEVDVAREAWVVRIAPGQNSSTETVFTFALRSAVPVSSQIGAYRNVLSSVSFTTSVAPSSKATMQSSAPAIVFPTSGTSASRAGGEGSICGGTAGILCPKGFFCKITDPVGESGVCTKR